MGDLKKTFVGQALKQFPGNTLNLLALGELVRRAGIPAPADSPGGVLKSPVHVQLLWTGEAAIAPGRVVKLGEVLIPPADDPSAPFSGLLFKSSAFLSTDQEEPFAITLGPIGPNEVGYGLMPDAWWAKVYINNLAHRHAGAPAAGTLLESGTSGLLIVWQPGAVGEQWCVVQLNDGGEKPRALRGTYYSGTTTLSVKNIVILDSGTDPRTPPVDVDQLVEVANIPADTYTGGEAVYADWSAANAQWEARPKSSGSETLRLLRAKAKGAVSPQATSFTVDNIIVEAGGQDPRSTPGDMAEELTVFKLQKEAFVDNEDVTIIYSPAVSTGIDWELLVVERNRALRGTVYSGTTTLLVDHIVVLDSGRDPRTDPTSTTETVSVTVINGDSFTSGDDVWADWSVANNRWEARSKGGGSSGGEAGVLLATATIPARSGGTPGNSTSYTVVEGTVSGSIYNYSTVAIASGSYMVVVLVDTHWIISAAFC